MAELESRLVNSFATVSLEFASQEITSVSLGSLASWDLVADISLLSVIEDQFLLGISPDDVAHRV